MPQYKSISRQTGFSPFLSPKQKATLFGIAFYFKVYFLLPLVAEVLTKAASPGFEPGLS